MLSLSFFLTLYPPSLLSPFFFLYYHYIAVVVMGNWGVIFRANSSAIF